MPDSEQFWRSSEIHAHQWILVHESPCDLSSNRCVIGRILVCPVCGRAWGKRTYRTALPIHFNAVERPCSEHSGGGLTRGRDYDHGLSNSDDLTRFLVEQYYLDSSVLLFHD